MCVEGKVVVDRWVGEGKKKDRKLGKRNPPNHVLHFCVGGGVVKVFISLTLNHSSKKGKTSNLGMHLCTPLPIPQPESGTSHVELIPIH